jgi:hypothetical protein
LAGATIHGLPAGDSKARFHVPRGQTAGRILALAELADFGEGIGVLGGFDPDRREAGLHKLGKPID